MAKAKLLGMRGAYFPNAKADMRYRKNVYMRGMALAATALCVTTARTILTVDPA